jgi:CheY-like chemotaxis protein
VNGKKKIVEPAAPSSESPKAAASPKHAHSAHILYADDDADVQFVYAKILRRAGYSVTLVRDGRQAWEALQEMSYDLLLTDYDMPHLNGVELLRRARLNGIGLPVIIISGNLMSINCEPLNFSAMLDKPVSLADLLGAVALALERKKETALEIHSRLPN